MGFAMKLSQKRAVHGEDRTGDESSHCKHRTKGGGSFIVCNTSFIWFTISAPLSARSPILAILHYVATDDNSLLKIGVGWLVLEELDEGGRWFREDLSSANPS
jgi:hypothetical protein